MKRITEIYRGHHQDAPRDESGFLELIKNAPATQDWVQMITDDLGRSYEAARGAVIIIEQVLVLLTRDLKEMQGTPLIRTDAFINCVSMYAMLDTIMRSPVIRLAIAHEETNPQQEPS